MNSVIDPASPSTTNTTNYDDLIIPSAKTSKMSTNNKQIDPYSAMPPLQVAVCWK